MSDPEIAALREVLAQRERPATIAERRRAFEAMAEQMPVARDIIFEPVTANGVRAEWSAAPGVKQDHALLYLHGGGYVIGSLASHRHMVSELGRAAGVRALALDYRLAPEHPFPAAVDDAVAGYRFLLASGFAPGRIAIGGDSAGGGLAVAAMVAIRDAGLPQPAGAWCISPWVDLEGVGESMTSLATVDPTVQRDVILELAPLYLSGAPARSPLAAPIYADLRGLAALVIQVGAAETLLDDAVRLARVAGIANVAVTLEIWPEMIHVWHLFHPRLAAGRRAIARGGAAICALFDTGAAS
jgi:epsilon-lactone hydrolase